MTPGISVHPDSKTIWSSHQVEVSAFKMEMGGAILEPKRDEETEDPPYEKSEAIKMEGRTWSSMGGVSLDSLVNPLSNAERTECSCN